MTLLFLLPISPSSADIEKIVSIIFHMKRRELKSLYKYSWYISTDKDLLSDRQKGRRAFFKQTSRVSCNF